MRGSPHKKTENHEQNHDSRYMKSKWCESWLKKLEASFSPSPLPAKAESVPSTDEYYLVKKDPRTGREGFELIDPSILKSRDITVTESLLEFLDPREYDFGLAKEMYQVGTAYALLDPFFKPAKDIFLKSKFQLDPLVQSQLAASRNLAGTSGDILMAAFPSR